MSNTIATDDTPSCPICKEPVRDEPTDAKPHPDAIVEHRDCFYPSRGARWTLPAGLVTSDAKPIKLYLDDIRNPTDDSWTLVRTLQEAKSFLASGVIEYASLDHDLGECDACAAARGYQDPAVSCRHVGTGADLCDWMAETGHWPKHEPLVHSANPVGRANMLRTIARYFRASAGDEHVPVSPAPSLVDHVIAALREATSGQRLIPPWRTWGESPWRRAQRGVRGVHWALVIEEPGSAPLEQQMAEMDAELRRANGYRLTEDVVREAVASWNASAEPAGEVDDAPGEPPAFVTEAFERLVAAGRGAIDAFNNIHGPLLPEVTPTAIAMPKNVRDSICRVLTTSPRDWSMTHEDAWIYGVVCGWPEDAIEEVAAHHRWSPITVDRLRVLHEEWENVSPGIAVEANAERKPTPSLLVLAARDLLDALPKCWGDTNGSGGHRTYAHDCDRFAKWIDKADGEAHCDKHVWKWEIEKQFKAHVDYQDQATRLASILSQETAAVPAESISSDHGRTATDEDVERTWKTLWAGTVAPNGVVDLDAVKRELFDYACLLDAVPKVYMHVTGGKVSKPTTLPDVVIAMADDRTTEAAEERVAEVAALAAAWERLYRARDAYHDHSFKAEWDLYEAALSVVRACGGKPPEDTYEEQRSKALASGVELKTEAAIEREVEAARARAAEREERRPSIDGHTEVAMINVFATPGGKPPTGWPEPGETP